MLFTASANAQTQSQELDIKQLRSKLIQSDFRAAENILIKPGNRTLFNITDRPILSYAAIEANPKAIVFLVKMGAALDFKDRDGYTAVMRALEHNRIDNFLELLELGASLDGVANDGMSVRVLAERIGLEQTGPEYNSNPTLKIEKNEVNELLLAAAEAGDVLAIKFALKNSADIHAKANNGWTPIMLTALGKHWASYNFLVKEGALENGGHYKNRTKKITLVQAILLGSKFDSGIGGFNALSKLSKRKDYSAQFEDENLRRYVKNLGLQNKFLKFFTIPAVPVVKLGILSSGDGKAEEWKQIQVILSRANLYKGSIDGKPGAQTYRALYAYVAPYLSLIQNDSLKAHQRSKSLNKSNFSKEGYYSYSEYTDDLGKLSKTHTLQDDSSLSITHYYDKSGNKQSVSTLAFILNRVLIINVTQSKIVVGIKNLSNDEQVFYQEFKNSFDWSLELFSS